MTDILMISKRYNIYGVIAGDRSEISLYCKKEH